MSDIDTVSYYVIIATADTAVRGVPIAAGESVLLSYGSASRAEEVFDGPFRFDSGHGVLEAQAHGSNLSRGVGSSHG